MKSVSREHCYRTRTRSNGARPGSSLGWLDTLDTQLRLDSKGYDSGNGVIQLYDPAGRSPAGREGERAFRAWGTTRPTRRFSRSHLGTPSPRGRSPGGSEQHEKKPRWFEPRFEGALREEIPPGTLDGIRQQFTRLGFRVEEEPEATISYRASAAPRRELRVEHGARAFVGTFDSVRIWQEDETTLRYEGSFRRWAFQLFFVGIVFAVVWGAVVMACMSLAFYAGLILAVPFYLPVSLLKGQRRRACAAVERVLREELRRAYLARSAQPGVSPVRVVAEPSPATTQAPVARGGIRVQDPALAGAVRTARDAFVRHHERSPEDEVEALEEAARRRGE
jgi:hypothetical protein